MKNIECIYYKDSNCINAEMPRKKNGEIQVCVLYGKIKTEKTITVCKLRANTRLMGGIWTVA